MAAIAPVWEWENPPHDLDASHRGVARVGTEAGECVEDAAAREMLEETGWRPGPLRHLLSIEPSNGLSDAVHHVYWSDSGEHHGEPEDAFESDRIEWVPLKEVPDMIARGEVRSSNAVSALLMLHRLRGL